jgi:nicotinate-nucleotide pyrophosphorylase (carboxylating)
LYDAMMVKENHILAAGSIEAAVQHARTLHPGVPLIVEVENLDELDQALAARPERILIDEFSAADLRTAVQRAGGRVPLEVSGGVELANVHAIAEAGVDCISIGGLTKHVQAIDLSLRFGAPPP